MKKKRSKTVIRQKSVSETSPRFKIRRFIFIYLAMMGAFSLIIGLTAVRKVIDINGLYTEAIVVITSKFLNILNMPATYYGSVINLPAIALDLKFGCNGLEAVMIYSIAVIAFPSSWKKRLVGILTGFLFIQFINILRIVGLAYTGIHHKSLFDYMHIYVAQGIMIAIALGIFFLYLSYATADGKTVA
ncbi:MAG: archaeosortase/exosortase family protein [Nitrospirota bacterium]